MGKDRTSDNKNIIISFVYSFIILLFISQDSPLCKFNMWLDPTVYQGVISAMNKGSVLYVDVFDHKGPFFYEIMALVNLFVGNPRITMFIFEVVSIGLFILFSYKISKFYLSDRQAMISAILLVSIFLILPNSKATGETEEILIGLLMIVFYFWNKYWKEKNLKKSEIFTVGLMMGIVFLSKFTVAFEGLCLFGLVVLYECFTGRLMDGLKKALLLLGGFFSSFIPNFIYCIATDSLVATVNNYFLFNLTYGKEIPELSCDIPYFLVFMLIILISAALYGQFKLDGEISKFKFVSLMVYTAGMALMIICSQRYYEYLFNVFYPVIIFAVILAAKHVNKKIPDYPVWAGLALVTILLNASIFTAPNWIWCEKTGNEILADDIASALNTENPSILLLQAEYGGVFELNHTYPQLRYFYSPNINNNSDTTVFDEQAGYIIDGEPDVIILKDTEYLEYAGENYSLLGTYEIVQRRGEQPILQIVLIRNT